MEQDFIELVEIEFTAAELRQLPEHELRFLVSSGLATNDLTVFARLLLMHSHSRSDSELASKMATANILILQRHLIAKVFEFVKTIFDFKKIIERRQFAEVDGSIFEIARAIGDSEQFKIARHIRTHLTNHYLIEKAFILTCH